MAIAATSAMSTALSPMTWQPNVLQVLRSTISLQKPNLRPSMTLRVVQSKFITAVRMSWVARAFASVGPTCAYSGSVKLPAGFTRSPTGMVGPSTALVAATKPSGSACETSITRPVTSPAAKMWGAEVRRYSSTLTNFRALTSTPAAARLSPAVSAAQPTATTTSAASALSRRPSFEKFIRTPVGVFSNDSMAPKFSRTTMPDLRNADAAAAATSSSSVARMRGPASNSSTRVPKALKIEATCAPVAPAPTTSIEGGTEVSLQASLCVLVSSMPPTGASALNQSLDLLRFFLADFFFVQSTPTVPPAISPRSRADAQQEVSQ